MTDDRPAHASPSGRAARAVVLEARQVGGRDREGRALFALDLTVLPADEPPRRARVSVPVPDAALADVYPGAELPAVLVGSGDDAVVVLDLEHRAAPADQPAPGGATVVPAAGSAAPTPGRETR